MENHKAKVPCALKRSLFIAGASSLFLSTSIAHAGYSIEAIGLFDEEHTRSSDGYQYSKIMNSFTAGYYSSTTPNSDGVVAGISKRYSPSGSELGQSAWVYDGNNTIRIGLLDGMTYDDYTSISSTVDRINSSGYVAGRTNSYSLSENYTWLYNGTTTEKIGLYDASGEGSNYINRMNQAGQVIGRGSTSSSNGQMGWLYDGSNTVALGLRDADHTKLNGYGESNAYYLNENGQVAGVSSQYREYTYYTGDLVSTLAGQSAWFYNGVSTVRVGLFDAEHTKVDEDFVNFQNTELQGLSNGGHVTGISSRYAADGAGLGASLWLYNGVQTVNIGMTDAEHTRVTDGYRWSGSTTHSSPLMNDSGYVASTAERFNATGGYWGQSAIYYDGNTTRVIGLTDDEHTMQTDIFGAGSAGRRQSFVHRMNQAGQVLGWSYRNGYRDYGQSVWLFDGVESKKIGLTDNEHTFNGWKKVSVAGDLNEAGQAIGYSMRYSEYDPETGDLVEAREGQSAWFYDGAATRNIGLTDEEHTHTDEQYSKRHSVARYLNEAGQVAGYSYRYGDAGEDMGQTAWLFDGDVTLTIDQLSVRGDGYAYSEVNFLGEDGLVLGFYKAYDESDAYLGDYAFGFTEDLGVFDLGMLAGYRFKTDDWDYLASALSSALDGDGELFFLGQGYKLDGSEMAFKVSVSSVPVPAAIWLFGSGLLGLVGMARRKQAA